MRWEELKRIGQWWRSQFPTIEFLGEIDVDPATIEEVCRIIGRHLGSATDDEDFRAALAVTVVNLAYDTEEEALPSFRNHVLRKFGQATDTTIWENLIGHPVEKILERYFHEHPTSGPFRYVTPILRQAGVPARSLGQFSNFFRDLIQRYGWRFSKEQFDRFLATQNHSWRLQEFLKTEVGWRFCLDLARILLHRRRGLLNEETLRLLPGFRGGMLERLWELIQMAPTHNRLIPIPRLILDVNKRKLAIEFAEEGLDKGYFWANGQRIRLGRHYLEEGDFHRELFVRINQPDGQSEYCKIRPWLPDRRPWAVFHHSNGAYQNNVCPLPGRHLLALPESVELPAEVQIHEEIGELYLPDWQGQIIRIIDCELPPSLSLPEIKLKIGVSPAAFPSLTFGRSPSP